MRRSLLAILVGLLAVLVPATAALAHPLGNFTVNRYTRIEPTPSGAGGASGLRLRYVVDYAEIPTFQALPAVDADGNGTVGEAEAAAFARRSVEDALPRLSLRVDGTPVPLRALSSELQVLPGQAGLQTMRLAAWLEAPGAGALLAGGTVPARIDYHDGNDPERSGWREVLVRAPGLPGVDLSDELRAYPENLLQSPPNARGVSFALAPGGAATLLDGALPANAPLPAAAPTGGTSLVRSAGQLSAVLTQATLTPPLIAAALLTAVLLGAMHALSPGHGKTVVGAYLIGSRGTPRHALFLGLTVTLVHTAGVFALGLVTLLAARTVVPERIFPWLSLISGLLVLGMGVSLIRARWRAARGASPLPAGHDHDHGEHGHAGHGHGHDDHDHGFGAHRHDVPGADGQAVTWRSLLALGISGGLLPCPTALVVMLGAIALQRVLFGLVLVVAFSAGLAATLSAIGLAMVLSGRVVGRLAARLRARSGDAGTVAALWRLGRLLPAASAAVVALAGLGLTVEATRQLDLFAGVSFSAPPAGTLTALSAALAALAAAVWLRRRRPLLLAAYAAGHGPAHGHTHDHGHDHSHASDHGHEHEHPPVRGG